MKPEVDLNRAFSFLMEGGEDALEAYMDRLNAEHFNEDGSPKKTSKKPVRKDPEQMTTQQLVAEMDIRGLQEYDTKKVTRRKIKVVNGQGVPAIKDTPLNRKEGKKPTPKNEIIDGFQTVEFEDEESIPKKYSDKEMIRQIKEDMDADDSAKPAPKQEITEKLKLRDMKAFPDDVLYVYLQNKSNSRASSDIAIMRGKNLQGRLILNADGTTKKPRAVLEDVADEVEEKFPSFKQIPARKRKPLLEEVIVLGFEAVSEAGDSERVKMTASEVVNNIKQDKDLLDILGLFRLRGEPLDEKIVKFYFDKFRSPKRTLTRNRGWENYVKKNIRLGFDKMDTDRAIKILDTSIPEYLIPIMYPFKTMLKELGQKKTEGKGRYSISTLRASEIMGRIDTKDRKRRQEIYNYWKRINSEFEDFKEAHNAFKDAIDQISDQYSPELKKVFDEFVAFKVEELNYIALYERVEIEDIANIEDKAISLIMEFLKENAQLPKADITMLDEDRKTIDDIPMEDYAAMVDELESLDSEDDLKDKINSFSKIKVDPLYAYAAERDDTGALVAGASLKKQLREIERRMKTGLVIIDMGDLIPRLESHIKDLQQMEVGSVRELYLPVMKELGRTSEDDEKVHQRIQKYLETVNEFIEFGTDFERRSKAGSVGLGQQERKTKEGETMREARSPRASFGRAGAGLTHIKELNRLNIGDKFEDLIKAIVDFYIEPSRSKFKPSDIPLEFIEKVGSRPIENIAMETNAEVSPLIALLRMESNEFSLSLGQIKEIRDFSQLLTGLNVGSKQEELLQTTKKLADEIDDIYDGEITNAVNVEFGNFLHNIFDESGLDAKEFGLGGSKKPTSEWAKDYEASKVYPFEAVLNHLISNKETYKDKVKGSESLIGNIEQAETDLKITKSEEQTLILKAHDEIRKMLGKPIYYGMSNIENYDAVSEAIDLMNDKYNVDMSAMEVEKVVKELDSMSNIGTKYGIPQEGVYFLKANFR